MSANGRGTWYVRPTPSLHRCAGSILVMVRPSKRISPAPGARSPEMRPNRLVLPAPFGPTIPTASPVPTASDRSSAMTTWPNRFVTPSSVSSASCVIRSRVSRLQIGGDLRVGLQRVVDSLHLHRELGALLPLHTDRRRNCDTWRRATRCKVQRPGHGLDVHLVDGVGHLSLVVRVAHRGESLVRRFEQAVVADVGVPLPVGGGLEVGGQLLARLAGE